MVYARWFLEVAFLKAKIFPGFWIYFWVFSTTLGLG